ncbi:sensor histidine kinase [Legionella clemsonensis]|uniref:histidine kinase n=1 Tax=Legionella clemsonensis TaxID=1867846 RepID=A0A222NZ12_9GAMM|nr:HAMP domain-containing sensor histidine kinase [Legionella clemsonensis]ASQ44785.1 Sensor protein FixL [Legionella clemsonensis]
MLAANWDLLLENELIHLRKKVKAQEIIIDKQARELGRLVSELLETKNQCTELYKFNSACYFTLNRDFIIKDANYQAAALFKCSINSLVHDSFLNFLSPKEAKKFTENLATIFEKPMKREFDLEMMLAGKLEPLHIEASITRKHRIHLVVTPQTDMKESQLKIFELTRSYELLNYLFQECEDAIAILDSELQFRLINHSFVNIASTIFAAKPKPGLNLNMLLVDFPELKTKILSACEQSLEGKKNSIVIESESDCWEAYYYYELFIDALPANNERRELVICIRDESAAKLQAVKERKQQAKIEHRARTAVAGELVSVIAHEINQPLAVIQAYSYSCLLRLADVSKELVFPLEQITLQASYAGEIIQRMKGFICEDSLYLEETDINRLIQKAVSLLYYEPTISKLSIHYKLAEHLPLIMVDRLKLMQVFLNLGRNSIEAFTPEQKQPEITIETALENHNLMIHFRDNGPGIPKNIRSKILNSHFTTKPHGTGLGLAICRNIIKNHGGKLVVQSYSGEGAWFTCVIPIKYS